MYFLHNNITINQEKLLNFCSQINLQIILYEIRRTNLRWKGQYL